MSEMMDVKAINIPAIDRAFSAMSAGAPNKTARKSNEIAHKISETARSTAPVGKKDGGQYKLGIIPRFSATKNSRLVAAEIHAIAPHSAFVEAGTGRRGRGSWKKQIADYVHGSRPGMKASNNLHNAALKHNKAYRDGMIKLINAGLS